MLKVVMGLDFVAGKCEKIETTPNTNMFKLVKGSDFGTEFIITIPVIIITTSERKPTQLQLYL